MTENFRILRHVFDALVVVIYNTKDNKTPLSPRCWQLHYGVRDASIASNIRSLLSLANSTKDGTSRNVL